MEITNPNPINQGNQESFQSRSIPNTDKKSARINIICIGIQKVVARFTAGINGAVSGI